MINTPLCLLDTVKERADTHLAGPVSLSIVRSLDSSHAEWFPERYWRQPRSRKEGGEGNNA